MRVQRSKYTDAEVTAVAISKTLMTTRGDIIYRNATVPARLAKGSDGDVLTMGANDPAWTTPAGGATITTGTFTGDGTTNRAIAHGLGVIPKFVFLVTKYSSIEIIYTIILDITTTVFGMGVTSAARKVGLAATTTNFYVTNTSSMFGNKDAKLIYWVAFG